MANLDKKQLDNAATKPNSNESAPVGANTGENPIEKKIDYLRLLIYGVVLVLVGIIVGMFTQFWQLQSQVYMDYKTTINDLTNKRWTELEGRVDTLEAKVATMSGK